MGKKCFDEYAVTDKNGVATFKDVLISGHESYTLEEVDTAERYIVPDSQRTCVCQLETA